MDITRPPLNWYLGEIRFEQRRTCPNYWWKKCQNVLYNWLHLYFGISIMFFFCTKVSDKGRSIFLFELNKSISFQINKSKMPKNLLCKIKNNLGGSWSCQIYNNVNPIIQVRMWDYLRLLEEECMCVCVCVCVTCVCYCLVVLYVLCVCV